MWNPDQYNRFSSERKQPFFDLLALIERRPAMDIADLGCGTGEWTRDLHDHLGARKTLGIDSSPTMLRDSRTFSTASLTFRQESIEEFAGDGRYDLLFSNAALQWVSDHETLFTRLAQSLAAGGQLAVQMPANEDHPSHLVAAGIASAMGVEPRRSAVLPLNHYGELLHRLGATRQHVSMQVYGHLLPSSSDVVQWVRGTLLIDYQRRMQEDEFATFLDRYRRRLLEVIGSAEPYFYTYKRILLWASW